MTPREIKAVLVTRHSLLPSQEDAILKAGFKIVEIVPQVPSEISELIKWCREQKQKGVEAIVTTALPIHLIPPILSAGLRLFVFKMNSIATVYSREEAERIKNEKQTHRIVLEGRLGEKATFRIVEFVGLYEIKEVKIVEELVVPA